MVKAYEKALLQALAQPEVQGKLRDGGITVSEMTGQQLRAFVTLQAAVYRDIATGSKITME